MDASCRVKIKGNISLNGGERIYHVPGSRDYERTVIDESKGERGYIARLADVDRLVHLSGDIIKTAVVKKANDQPEDVLTSFRLEPFDFGLDEDGDPFRTFILSDEIITGVGRTGHLFAAETFGVTPDVL